MDAKLNDIISALIMTTTQLLLPHSLGPSQLGNDLSYKQQKTSCRDPRISQVGCNSGHLAKGDDNELKINACHRWMEFSSSKILENEKEKQLGRGERGIRSL